VQGVAYLRWRQRSSVQRQKDWKLFGFFAAISCLGCASGALAYAPRMYQLTSRYKADSINDMQTKNRSLSESQLLNELRADQRRFTAAFYALFPVELAFVSVAYLLVLHRMQSFAVKKSKHSWRWIVAGRFFLVAVVLLNVVGVVGNIAAAVSYKQAADFSSLASKAYAVNDTVAGRDFEVRARGAGEVASVQRFCEVLVLVMITAAFLIVGANNAAIISSALRVLLSAEENLSSSASFSDNGDIQTHAAARIQGQKLFIKVVGTVVFVFCTFLVRSVFTVLYAVAQSFPDNGKSCDSSGSATDCDLCLGVYSHIQTFIIYEPAFQNVVMLLSSPLTLMVALWGMSTERATRQVTDPL
jgi:hypothetical protein